MALSRHRHGGLKCRFLTDGVEKRLVIFGEQ
jgi:hypothetical protein